MSLAGLGQSDHLLSNLLLPWHMYVGSNSHATIFLSQITATTASVQAVQCRRRIKLKALPGLLMTVATKAVMVQCGFD
jgi:hypothetical protein